MEFRIDDIGDLLLEGRVEDAKKRFPEYTDEVFNLFVEGDPSGNQKYLMWMLSVVPEKVRGLPIDSPGDSRPRDWVGIMLRNVTLFHNNLSSFEIRDINQYKSFEGFRKIVSEVMEVVAEKEALKKAKKESIRLLDTPEHLIIIPKSYEASCVYGAGTRWCTTAKESDNYYKQYTSSGTLVYVIRKNLPENDNLHKIAFHIKNDGGVQIYDAPDIEISKDWLVENNLGVEEWDVIRGSIVDYLDETNNQNLEFFLNKEEILSYIESKGIDILKLSDKRLMSTFGTVEALVDYVVSKGLNPLEVLRLGTLIDYINIDDLFIVLDKHNINKFDIIDDEMRLSTIYDMLGKLSTHYLRQPILSSVDVVHTILNELNESKFLGLENFANHIETVFTKRDVFVVMKLLFLDEMDLIVGYLNEHNLELTDYLSISNIVKVYGNKSGEYFMGGGNDDRFLFFMENAGLLLLRIDSLLKIGFKKEDVFYMIEEAVIKYSDITMENLNLLFDNKVKTGIRWFFDNVRMDIYISDVGNYSITLVDLAEMVGSDIMKFIEQELKKLGEGESNYSILDFTDESELNEFFQENLTITELYEMFVNVNSDMGGFIDATTKYDMEISDLHKIIIINEPITTSDEINNLIEEYKDDIIGGISDVEKREDGLYLISNTWCDFSRWMGHEDTKNAFNYYFCEEDNYEMFSSTYYDWESDVWGSVMNTNNVEHVRGHLKDNYVGATVDDEDGEEYTLTMEVIDGLDEGEMGTLINEDESLDDLKSGLSEAYHWAYNHAYESEVSDELVTEINEIIGSDKPKYETVKRKNWKGEETGKEQLVHKLTNFWDHLHTYSEALLNDHWSNDELEHSEFSEMVADMMEMDIISNIDIRVPDYPDHTKIYEQFKDLINEYT